MSSGQQNESSSEESEEDDRPDEYEGQAYYASNLNWLEKSRKHYQAFSLLHRQFSHLNERYPQRIANLRAHGETERSKALPGEFSRRTNELWESMCSTRNAADFCLIMKHYDNKDGDPEDRSFERLPLFPDQVQAAAIGTMSLNQELRSATRPYPLPWKVTAAAFAETQRPSERIPSKTEYQDILYSQRHSMEECLEEELSDYLPETLSSMISELDTPDNCGQAFPHIFDAINAHSEPWAPNYPPATLPSTRPPPRSTSSAQSGYTENTQRSRQPNYSPSSSAPPPDPGYPYSTSRGAPPQFSSSTSGHPQSGYQSTNFPSSGGRDGNSANYYSARRVDLLRRTQDADHDTENTKPAAKIRYRLASLSSRPKPSILIDVAR